MNRTTTAGSTSQPCPTCRAFTNHGQSCPDPWHRFLPAAQPKPDLHREAARAYAKADPEMAYVPGMAVEPWPALTAAINRAVELTEHRVRAEMAAEMDRLEAQNAALTRAEMERASERDQARAQLAAMTTERDAHRVRAEAEGGPV
jgi:hypothetical protein